MGRPRPLRPLRQALETGALRLLAGIARALPLETASDLGAFLGGVARRILPRRRRIAEENLRDALGLSETEAARAARAVFTQLGRSFVEFLALPAHGWDELERRVTSDGGIERLRAWNESGRGAVLVTGHFGNWELLGASLGHRAGGVAYVFPAQSNPGTDAFINETRRRLGVELIPMEQGMRRALRRILHGGNIGMLVDQDARRIGIHLPFFGRPASTLTGAARLAIRGRAPLYVTLLERTGRARFHARLLDWMEPREGADEEAEVARLTLALNEALERAIRERPDHWYWIHRRWKTPPPATS
ncbi:MAG TPA: lysophospholipid acyltransferase family protein [Acidobacteriota bacterium]|nr:lysophospholipid acyltransferase family protein [Acidobacteriota bacterium]